MAGLYKKILCPIDFSAFSSKALEKAAALTRIFDAKLILAHIITNPWSDQYLTGDDKHVRKDKVISLVKNKIKDFAEQHQLGVNYETVVTMHEHSYRGIIEFASLVEYATIEQVDLIVLSTHGVSVSPKLFLGSVAEAVVRQAPCSVLVVR